MKEHVRRRWLQTARLWLVEKIRGFIGIEIRSSTSRMCETDELANEPQNIFSKSSAMSDCHNTCHSRT